MKTALAHPTRTTASTPAGDREARAAEGAQAPLLGGAAVTHRLGQYSLRAPRPVGRVATADAPIQRVLTHDNAQDKADRFLLLHNQERAHHDELNARLATYSHAPTQHNYDAANDGIKTLKDRINAIHNEMAGLTAEYSASNDQGHRRRFMQRFLGNDYSHQLEARFKDFTERAELDDADDHVADVHKNRFLAHGLQNLRFAAGRGRFNELMANIDHGRGDQDPKRKIKIATMNYGAPKAGLADDQDVAHGHKTDQRDANADAQTLQQSGNNLTEFIARKRQAGDQRTANVNRGQIGDLKVFMDRGGMVGDQNPTFASPLVPMYYGHNNRQEVEAYTSPIHTAIHHELGHLTNSLKGIEGPAHDHYHHGLAPLTNEEELYNVHLDQHSDQALSDEMHLPTRIAHTAFGGLDSANADLPQNIVQQDLQTWDTRTHNVEAHKRTLLQAIKTAADSGEWSRHTKGWSSRPSTVGTIRGRLGQIPGTGADMRTTLEQIRQDAADAHQAGNSNRKAATTAFYNVLRNMDLNSRAGLSAAIGAVNIHRATHLVPAN